MRLHANAAFAALLCGLALSAHTRAAEPVQVYDNQVPSVDALRSILVPRAKSRRIILSSKSDEASTPSDAAASGAPAAPAPTAVAFHVNFAFNSAAIPPASDAQLDNVVELLRQEPTLTLRIEGHTDASGDPGYNLKLSRRRADSVKTYMIEHGVDGARLVAVGKGRAEPLTADPFDASNRRVQFANAKGHS